MKVLTPDKLMTLPSDVSAEKHYKHWLKTLENFIEDCGSQAPDRLWCLTKYVSPDVYDYVSEVSTYEAAIGVLNKLYVKSKNDIFSRHQLATRNQKSTETLDEYIQELHKLAKHINFKKVDANGYKEDMIRDSFINGIQST